MSLIYGQPEREYQLFMPFAETRLKCGQIGGFKLHVTVDTDDADRLARVILPELRLLRAHHKVVLAAGFYRQMSNGDQRGKFITVYAGAAASAQRVADAIDPALCWPIGMVHPGPLSATSPDNSWPMTRGYSRNGCEPWKI